MRRPERAIHDELDRGQGAWLQRREYPGTDQRYRLNDRELETLRTVGMFRAIEAKDLDTRVVQYLQNEGLLNSLTAYPERAKGHSLKAMVRPLRVVTLSDEARKLIDQQRGLDDPQKLYNGFVKPQELAHDCAGYRAYREERQRIEDAGGKVNRVVLDFELKSQINADLNRATKGEERKVRENLARELELPLINGKVMMPDVRVEYQDEHGAERHIDIEVVTRHYKGAHRASKVASGFKLVNMHGNRSASKKGGALGKVIYDHDLGFL